MNNGSISSMLLSIFSESGPRRIANVTLRIQVCDYRGLDAF